MLMDTPGIRDWFKRPMMGKRILLIARSRPLTGDVMDMVMMMDEIDGLPYERERILSGSRLIEEPTTGTYSWTRLIPESLPR